MPALNNRPESNAYQAPFRPFAFFGVRVIDSYKNSRHANESGRNEPLLQTRKRIMIPKQIELVQVSFQMVQPIADKAARLFYDRLFEIDPALRPMFRGDIGEQGRELMQIIGVAVGSLRRMEQLLPAVEVANDCRGISVTIMASPGVYVFKRNGRVAYVGRSDRDVNERESASYRQGRYDSIGTTAPPCFTIRRAPAKHSSSNAAFSTGTTRATTSGI
jgi:hypothetical protein